MTEQGKPGMPSPELAEEAQRLAGVVLVRIAVGPGDEEAAVARDLAALLGTKGNGDVWRIELGRLLAALIAGGLADRDGNRLNPTAQGLSAVAEFLGLKKSLPTTWQVARDIHLVAKALSLTSAPASRLRLLRKADGLRALIVANHFDLRIRGVPSAPRLRSALAAKALDRAFGNQGGTATREKSTLPPKAARLLAAELSTSGREFASDARLIAALAAEAIGSRRSDLNSLRIAVLRRFLGRPSEANRPRRARRKLSSRGETTPPRTPPAGSGTPAIEPSLEHALGNSPPAAVVPHGSPESGYRPTPTSFADAVLVAANEAADGWAGNRKAFISKVWALVRERYAAWALSEIEFKCMLTEAHRTGLVTLANADLKDKRALKELEDSAVIYKNTVWHYVRATD